MKKRHFPILLLLLISVSGVGMIQAANYDNYSGFATVENPILPEREIHPKLWFGKAEITDIFKRRNADQYAKSLWEGISFKIKYYKESPFPLIPDSGSNKDVQRYYGTMSKSARYLALSWLMNGDERARDKAIEGLLRAFDGPIYQMDPKEESVGVDEIYIATWVQNYCSAYDWIFNELTPEQNREIRSRLIKMGDWIDRNLDIWGPRPHNHRSKPAWALGSLALTLSAEPQAKKWLAHSLRSANSNTKYFFSSDGVYREGSHYLIYSMVNFLPFLYHYKNVSGVNHFPVYQPVFDWMLKVRNGRGWLPNIEDAYLKPTPLHMVAKEYMNVTSALNPNVKLGNLYQWSFCNSDFGPWQSNKGSYTGASIDDSWDLDEYLTYDPSIQPIGPSVSAIVFMDQGGQTVFRNNWKYNDPSTRYLLFHGVSEADNHNHHDQLSFIIQAENQMMAADCGYSTGSYHDTERADWYLKAEAHNTVTLNGEYPKERAENITPVSRYNIATDFCGFQEKEAYYPKDKGVIRRAVAFPGLDYFVIADQLTGDGEYQLSLHGGRGRMSGEGNFRIWDYDADQYGGAARMAVWTLPAQAQFSRGEGAVTYVKKDAAKYPYLITSLTAKDPLFMQVIIPLNVSAKIPAFTDLSTKDYLAVELEKENYRDYHLLKNRDNLVKFGVVETDATFCWIRTGDAQVNRGLLRQGKVCKVQGRELFVANLPLSLAFETRDHLISGYVSSQDKAYELKLGLPQSKTVDKVSFNGRNIPYVIKDGIIELSLSGSGDFLVTLK